ncbi:MAG: hypothetical protein JKX70_05875 [Phycisphaerales bacterium]|nr:hypothetical protein [Phycisphaerales bacterium]PCI09446.1 MAG: hypothetical protein COB72_06370 [bacterium]
MLAQIKKPVVVVDLSYIQDLSRGHEFLSSKSFWLWPLRIFQEASDKGEKARCILAKTLRVFLQNEKRSVIAASPRELSLDEVDGNSISMQSLVDIKMTQMIGAIANSKSTTQLLEILDLQNTHLNQGHNVFWSLLLLSNKSNASEKTKVVFMKSIEDDRLLVTDELAHAHFIELIKPLDSNSEQTTPSLDELYKTNSPLIAIAKCLLYLSLRMQTKPLTKEELNDYDDLHYAVLGSLTGHLATNDYGLARMVHVCFPETTIITNIPKIQQMTTMPMIESGR